MFPVQAEIAFHYPHVKQDCEKWDSLLIRLDADPAIR